MPPGLTVSPAFSPATSRATRSPSRSRRSTPTASTPLAPGPRLRARKRSTPASTLSAASVCAEQQRHQLQFRGDWRQRVRHVYVDQNINGVLDPTEPGIGGVSVEILNGSGQPVATTRPRATALIRSRACRTAPTPSSKRLRTVTASARPPRSGICLVPVGGSLTGENFGNTRLHQRRRLCGRQ